MNTNDYPDWSTLSLCTDCVQHESLKNFIRLHAGAAERCGGCLRKSPDVMICDITQRPRLSYLLRALIRYYYDETDYNPHFGGDSPQDILFGENPILALDKKLISIHPSWDVMDFVGDLVAELPHPKYSEGIWIYHQNDGCLASAISRSESPVLRDIRIRLRKENHFILEPLVRDQLVQIGSRIELAISSGTRFYRARIGIAGHIDIFKDFHTQQFPRPYQGDELSAPPARIATAGRLNRAGVSFLYLASDAHTAACEVRPHPSHLLSIGVFESTRPLRIANFATEISAFAENDIQLTFSILSTRQIERWAFRYCLGQRIDTW